MLTGIETHLETLQAMAADGMPIRRSDAIDAGVSASALTRMVRTGELVRVGRGLYQLAQGEGYSHSDLVEAALQIPAGVVVLISAFGFHGIGTHSARQVWLQLPANYPAPKIQSPPVRIVRTRLKNAFTEGVETHQIAGHSVRITSIDRTIVDCFKHRSLVGLEVCLEALRERLSNRKDSLRDLHRFARMMRVSKVMQPYLEALS